MRTAIHRLRAGLVVLAFLILAAIPARRAPAVEPPDPAAVERGRKALLEGSYLRAEWADAAFTGASKFWGEPAPDPVADPDGYARAFGKRYGFHPAPFPNDGLPMGLKRSVRADGKTRGFQVDCMACHGGSIGGKSYVGLPNTQIDYTGFFADLFRADGRRSPLVPFVLNTARGTTNAGMMSVVLMSVRNPDLSMRPFPMPMGSNLPELDAPPWWVLKYKTKMYYDGRTPADSSRSIMQFLLAEKTADQFRELEPTFADIHAYLKSIEAPRYPFPIDQDAAGRGRAVFEKSCAGCHGTYGEMVDYPGEIVPLDVIGTDPARIAGLSDRFVEHYNGTWFAEKHPVDVDSERGYQAPPLVGIWASAPYLHNGAVPTLRTLLDSPRRPERYLRPPSTDFEHYDPRDVGWKFAEVPEGPTGAKEPRRLFDASRYGLDNGGHTFGDKLGEAERTDLIEYLKTL
ncbi:c-type cytochrome [Planctomyces sp. SH-PL62]|uniref:c-type cytochrome n=1 Tax=Planctomyces sp. SH-PL62 TaxID=1636152 RepID=UPI00078C6C9F|nr:c-type cytochrome [Planctomyces sp. SH-PL62]AMV36286.1 Cytochrome c [Planctomyces sp. SH-PL62]